MSVRNLFNKTGLWIILYLAVWTCVQGVPVSSNQVQQAARGWLKQNPAPMEREINNHAGTAQAFSEPSGRTLYHVLPLQPSGFVILSADDEIEPVIAFSETGHFNRAEGNPLKILLEKDMKGRLDFVKQKNEIRAKSRAYAAGFNLDLSKQKWQSLLLSGESQTQGEETILAAGAPSVSDVRVAPLLQSKWDQGDVDGGHCYNYYTPNNYVTGCVATAMAQLLRYHSWPTAGIGVHTFMIHVDDAEQYWNTRGGNGLGGPYNWNQMPYDPQAGGLTESQRQAIGALCYDAGLSVGMGYTSGGSGAGVGSANGAFKNTFGYSNSVFSNSFSSSGDAGLWGMMNADLDAGLPVLLGISGPGVGHAIVADGYGYNSGQMYHHLNMGWGESDNAWYQLPSFTVTYTFDAITDCVYNVYPSGTGEIVSGRVTSMAGAVLEGVTVTAYLGSTPVQQATTNSRGIYALKNLTSNTAFRLSAIKSGYAFVDRTISTGLSQDWNAVSGNQWAVDFAATNPMPPTAIDQIVDANSLGPVVIVLEAVDDHLPNPPAAMTFKVLSLPSHGTLSLTDGTAILGVPYVLPNGTDAVQYAPCPYFGEQDSFTFTANDGGVNPTGGESNPATVSLNVDNTLKSEFGLDGNRATNEIIHTGFYALRSQALYLQSDMGASRYITDLAVNFTTKPPVVLNQWTLRMQHTTMSEYDDVVEDFLTSGWTIVYQNDVTIAKSGWYNFHFQTPFFYDGVSNLLIDFSFNNTSISENTGWYLYKEVPGSRITTVVTPKSEHTSPLTWDFWYNDGKCYGGGCLPAIKLIGTVPIDPMVGDFDLSCSVAMPDLAMLSAAWMTQSGQADYNPACDIASPKDNQVNVADLAVFISQWMQVYP